MVEKAWEHKDTVIYSGVGALTGFISGSLVKSFAKMAFIIGGVGYLALQAGFHIPAMLAGQQEALEKLEHELEEKITPWADVNGDGKISIEDVKSGWKKAQPWLSKHLPLSAGFLSGFSWAILK